MHNAFTLIELLVVVAIISILAAIAVPSYQSALVHSKLARAHADMDAVHKAVIMKHLDDSKLTIIPTTLMLGPFCSMYLSLTTPISYLPSKDRALDVFGTYQMEAIWDIIFGSQVQPTGSKHSCYIFQYEHHQFSNFKTPLRKWYLKGSHFRISLGPDKDWDRGLFSNVSSNNTIHTVFYRGDAYVTSNGLFSNGDLMFTNNNLDQIYTDIDQFP